MKIFLIITCYVLSLTLLAKPIHYWVNTGVRIADVNGNNVTEYTLNTATELTRVNELDNGRWKAFRVNNARDNNIIDGQIYYMWEGMEEDNVTAEAMMSVAPVTSSLLTIENSFPLIREGTKGKDIISKKTKGVSLIVIDSPASLPGLKIVQVVKAPDGSGVYPERRYEAYASFVDNLDNFEASSASIGHTSSNIQNNIEEQTISPGGCGDLPAAEPSTPPENNTGQLVVVGEEYARDSGVDMKKFDCNEYNQASYMKRCAPYIRKALAGRKVVLDPGHIGGINVQDSRSFKPDGKKKFGDTEGMREGKEALKVSLIIKKAIEECFGSDEGAPIVHLTREDLKGEYNAYDNQGRAIGKKKYESYSSSNALDLYGRSQLANELGADIFISIHTNGGATEHVTTKNNYGRIQTPRRPLDPRRYKSQKFTGKQIYDDFRERTFTQSNIFKQMMWDSFERNFLDDSTNVGKVFKESKWDMKHFVYNRGDSLGYDNVVVVNNKADIVDQPVFRNVIGTNSGIPVVLLEPYLHSSKHVWDNLTGKEEFYGHNEIEFKDEKYPSNEINEVYAKSVVEGIANYFGSKFGGCN